MLFNPPVPIEHVKAQEVEAAVTPSPAVVSVHSPEDIERAAYRIARTAGLSETEVEKFVRTMHNESIGFTNLGQSQILNSKGPNGHEDSWGVCQIHLPSHPEITRAQATDPVWCLTWSAQEFVEGRANRWTEYRKL